MDQIDSCISNGMHITKNSAFIEKTWKDFEISCQDKKLIFYGISGMLRFMSLRCNENILVSAAVDNDEEKQGHTLDEIFDDEYIKNSQKVKIFNKTILNDYNPDEIVVLISSTRYYEEIAVDLEKKNIHNYFSILNLEYNYRKYMKEKNLPFETGETQREEYVNYCIEKYPIQINKLVFYGQGCYSDHGKYITEQLLKMNKKLDIVWIVNRLSVKVPENVRIVYNEKWKQYIYEMETAKFWIYDTTVPAFLRKRDEQIYIQTKHWSSITIKKFYLDVPSIINIGSYKKDWELNGNWIDYIISGSEFDENSCRRGFNFHKNFLRFGSPRSDALFRPEKYKEKVFNQFNLTPNEHILLYVPTYRFNDNKVGSNDLKWQNLDFDKLLDSLKRRWQGNWKIFIKLHPIIRIRSKQIQMPEFVVDVSNYEDVMELVAASDVVISDFSSIAMDPAYVLKPVFLYSPDKDVYEKKDYELLLDYNSLPFPISTTNEELSEQIMNFDEIVYKANVQEFLNKYKVHEDGNASERAAEFIIKIFELGEKI